MKLFKQVFILQSLILAAVIIPVCAQETLLRFGAGSTSDLVVGAGRVGAAFGVPTQEVVDNSVAYIGSEGLAYFSNGTRLFSTGYYDINNNAATMMGLLSDTPPNSNEMVSRRAYNANPSTIEFAYNFDELYSGDIIVDFNIRTYFDASRYNPKNPRYGNYKFEMFCGTSTLSGSNLSVSGSSVASHVRSTTSMIPTLLVPTAGTLEATVENCSGLYFKITDNVTYHDWGNGSSQSRQFLKIKSIQLLDFPL